MVHVFATFPLSTYISAQGAVIDRKADGRVTIYTWTELVTGQPIRKVVATMVAVPATCYAINLETP